MYTNIVIACHMYTNIVSVCHQTYKNSMPCYDMYFILFYSFIFFVFNFFVLLFFAGRAHTQPLSDARPTHVHALTGRRASGAASELGALSADKHIHQWLDVEQRDAQDDEWCLNGFSLEGSRHHSSKCLEGLV